MEIKPIKTKADYRAALKEIGALMRAERDSTEGEHLGVLVTLVEAYKNRHYRLELPEPIEAMRFRMEQKGMTPKDLVPIIGRINRVYEILNRRRPLTPALQRLCHDWSILIRHKKQATVRGENQSGCACGHLNNFTRPAGRDS